MANLGGNELLDGVSGLGEAVRGYIVGVLAITYQKLEVRLRRAATAHLTRLEGEASVRRSGG